MKLFISWSGERSKKIAAVLYEWLPSVIQALKPYYSKEEIPKGRRWSPELARELEESHIGIIVLTPENLKSTFIHFEAGALSKNREAGRVSTILFDVKETDVESPLSEFQNTKFSKEDVFRLMQNLNHLLSESKLDDKVLQNVFEKMWPDLEKNANEILKTETSSEKPIRNQQEIVEEILEHVRKISGKISSAATQLSPGFIVPSSSIYHSVPWVQANQIQSGNILQQSRVDGLIADPATGNFTFIEVKGKDTNKGSENEDK